MSPLPSEIGLQMLGHIVTNMKDVVIYVLLCLITVSSGLGLLRVVRVKAEHNASLFLAPVITLSFWLVVLGLSVSAGIPVRDSWLAVWLLTAGLAAVGLWQQNLQTLRKESTHLLVAILAPVGLMAPYFLHGLTTFLGSSLPDGWSYIAFGQYLWQYPRGAEGGLAPLYQYAAHLANTRFTASSLLALLSPTVGAAGETQAATGYFLSLAFFVFGSTCAFFALSRGLRGTGLALYQTIVVFSGWPLALLWANNYDNVLAISFLPAILGVTALVDPRDLRSSFLLALLGSAALYSYPEMAPVFLGAGSLCVALRMLRGNCHREWLLVSAAAVVLIALMIGPYAQQMTTFFFGQLNMASVSNVVRPGEGFFPELLIPRLQVAGYWGLGGIESLGNHVVDRFWYVGRLILAATMSGLACVGALGLVRKKTWDFITIIAALFLASLVMLLDWAYSYGAYKFIVLNWWALCFSVVLGSGVVIRWARAWKHEYVAKAVLAGLFACLLLAFGFRVYLFDKSLPAKSIEPFSQIDAVKQIVGSDHVIVAVNDDLANEWAVYFLRDMPIRLLTYRVYMAQPHVIPFMNRAAPIDIRGSRYLLTDRTGFPSSPQASEVWAGGPYRLLKLPTEDWALITDIRNPNGLEEADGHQFFWLGTEPTEIDLLSGREGVVTIHASFHPGPSLPNSNVRTVLLSTSSGYSQRLVVTSPEDLSIQVPVIAGPSQVTLRCLDEPTVLHQPNGDTRPLLLQVRDMNVTAPE